MIYLASDIHGHIRIEWLRLQLNQLSLKESDYLIILGDAGMIWSQTEHLEVRAYYEGLPCKTLFLDGNHENFDLIYEHPVKEFCGGLVHQISDKLFHLMRGEIYCIDGKTFFCVWRRLFCKKTHERITCLCLGTGNAYRK